MEQLNRVTVRGTVGSIRITQVGDRKVARMSVATNYAYRAQDGSCVIETTWHTATVWESGQTPSLDDIARGDRVYLEGRLRNQRYTASDGTERSCAEIVASRLEKLPNGEPLTFEV